MSYLKTRRQQVHLTQQALADLAGVKLSMVADIESGRQQPSLATDEKLERAISGFADYSTVSFSALKSIMAEGIEKWLA